MSSKAKNRRRRHLIAEPKTIPNEGHIIRHLRAIRREKVERHKARRPAPKPDHQPRERVSPDSATRILEEVGFQPKRVPHREETFGN